MEEDGSTTSAGVRIASTISTTVPADGTSADRGLTCFVDVHCVWCSRQRKMAERDARIAVGLGLDGAAVQIDDVADQPEAPSKLRPWGILCRILLALTAEEIRQGFGVHAYAAVMNGQLGTPVV
jgi:hypothetical protein